MTKTRSGPLAERFGTWRAARVLAATALLAVAGCAVLDKPERPIVYDFGPGALAAAEPPGGARARLVLGDVEAPAALDGTALLYRLAFSNAQQLMPYSQARWSMPPAQLVRQRMQERLGRQRLVLAPTDASGGAPGPLLVLRLELEEFSHYFESASSSHGLVRMRATLSGAGAQGERLIGQRTLVLRQPAASADAAGGARALAEAVAAVAEEIDQWISQQR